MILELITLKYDTEKTKIFLYGEIQSSFYRSTIRIGK